MNQFEKYPREIFKELRKHSENKIINEPETVYNYTDIQEKIEKGWTLFIVKEEPILVCMDEEAVVTYFTKKASIYNKLSRQGETVIIPKEEYIFRMIYIVVTSVNGLSSKKFSYDNNRSAFLDKIFYFLEIPIDGYILSQYNIYPDIEATTLKKLTPLDDLK